MLFLSVRGFFDHAGPEQPLANNAAAVLPSFYSPWSQRPDLPVFSELNIPAHRCFRSTLQAAPRDAARKTRGQDGFATSFPVGLLHPLQHAGLSRRSVCYQQTGHSSRKGSIYVLFLSVLAATKQYQAKQDH
jgi:hypothetical protein